MPGDEPVPQLVVIGSSAGGIDALSRLVRTLPAEFPCPIVIAQHLDPSRQSHLTEILAGRSALPVRTVIDRAPLEPGVIYVVPANRHIEINDHSLHLSQQDEGRSKPSIDLLLRTAAEIFGERLIAVILTGMGSDGEIGARAVAAAGGTVVIENPATVAHSSMPASLDAASVDLSADVEQIGPLLHELATGTYSSVKPDEAEVMTALLEQLRRVSGVDFRSYKMPTIRRRLQRLVAATGAQSLRSYVSYLQREPQEYQRLVGSFLIKVTEFFRDPELFTYLREIVLPELIGYARTHNRELRFWSAGCATGEEAYSLAILVADLLGEEISSFTVRIFATDLDPDDVEVARRGIYSAASVAALPRELIERYFTERLGLYEVQKQIRALVIFGQHDLAQRAPFPRIDLTLCRNVLIYFTPELQRRALQLFAFSLRHAGVLVLGKTETTAPLADLFTLENPAIKLYRRKGDPVLLPPSRGPESAATSARSTPGRPLSSNLELTLARAQRESRRAQAAGLKSETLLGRLPVGVVVIDRRYDIISINPTARQMLGIHGSAIGEDLIHLAQSVPSDALRRAVDSAFRGEPETAVDEILTAESITGDPRYLQVICYAEELALDEKHKNEPAVMLLVNDVTRAVGKRHELEAAVAGQAAELARQSEILERLATVNRGLLEANRELSEVNAELRGANEEFLVGNEELQAATEEVETLNEELQATNEELETLNEELQATVEELNTTNDDLQARSAELQELAESRERQRWESDASRARIEAILGSMGDAVLVVGPDGKAVLTNAAYEQLFSADALALHPQDESGRPLVAEEMPLARAARGETFSMELTLQQGDGRRRWFEAKGRPVVGDPGGGGVVVIRDVTDRSLRLMQDRFVAMASHELRTPLTALRGYLQMVQRLLPPDGDQRIRSFVETALAQSVRLSQLVNELLDVARLQTGKLTLSLAPVDLARLLRQVADLGPVGKVPVALTYEPT